MVVEHLDSALLAWLGTYLVHSTILLLAAWMLGRALSRSRRLADALPSIRESLWRVALLAGLVTASAQRVLDVDPAQVLWTIETRAPIATTPALATAPGAPAKVATNDAQPTRPAPIARTRVEPALDAFPYLPVFLPGTLASAPAPVWIATALLASRLEAPSITPAAATPETKIALDVPRAATSVPAVPVASLAPPPASSGVSWSRLLLTLWLAGIAAGAALWAREWITLRRRIRGRVELDRGPVHEAFARLCRRTETRGVRLTCAPGLSAPITLGLVRSEIVLPPRATTQLSDDELEALFAHELAHARRGDPLWLVIYRALEVVFFFQPLNRIARVRLQDEAELLADDWAATQLAERVSLASCLTEIAGWIVDERRMLPAPAMAARGTRLSVRVRRLLDDEHHPERARRPHGLLLLAGSVVTGVALFGPAIAAERPASRPSPLATLVADDGAPDEQDEQVERSTACAEEPCTSEETPAPDDDAIDDDADVASDDGSSDEGAAAPDEEALDAHAGLLAKNAAKRGEAPTIARTLELHGSPVLPPNTPFLVQPAPAPARNGVTNPPSNAWYLARSDAPNGTSFGYAKLPEAIARAPKASTQSLVAVPVDVVGELQEELRQLRLVATQRDVTPEQERRLAELERDVALLQRRVAELGVLVQQSFTVSTTDQVP